MRIGEAMEVAAGVIMAVAIYVLAATVAGPGIGLGCSLLLVGAGVVYAAQVHEYGGNPVKRAKSS